MALPAILTDDEVVLDLVEGRQARRIGLLCSRPSGSSLHPQELGPDALIVNVQDVLTVRGRTHRGMSAVTINLGSGDVVVDQILGTQAVAFASYFLQALRLRSPRDTPLPLLTNVLLLRGTPSP